MEGWQLPSSTGAEDVSGFTGLQVAQTHLGQVDLGSWKVKEKTIVIFREEALACTKVGT